MVTMNPDVKPVCEGGGGVGAGVACEGRLPGARGEPMDADSTLLPEAFRTGIFDLSKAIDCDRSLRP